MVRYTHYWPGDVIYMRWIEPGESRKVVRVARTEGGGVIALYPTNNRERFNFEACQAVDDPGMRFDGLERDEVRSNGKADEIWLRLLDGEDIRSILRDYQPSPLGEGEENMGDNRFTYYFARRDSEGSGIDYHRHGMFHIVEMEEKGRESRRKGIQAKV